MGRVFFVCNAMGDSIECPSGEAMKQFLENVDANDAEHGAAWIQGEPDGWTLEWSVDERLVFDPGVGRPRHMTAVSRDRALELWLALAEGRDDEILRMPWRDGSGSRNATLSEAQHREWEQQQDRAFYDSLGDERSAHRCRAPGCERGAVAFSVFCRPHHFESIKHRSSPFAH